MDEPYLCQMWLLDKLVRKDHERLLLLKLLDNADTMVVLTKFLSVQDLVALLTVNRKAHGILKLAVVEVRLLREKVIVMERNLVKKQGTAAQLEMIEHYRNYAPILRMKRKTPQPPRKSLRQERAEKYTKSLNDFAEFLAQFRQPESNTEHPPQKQYRMEILPTDKFEEHYRAPQMVVEEHSPEHQRRMIDFFLSKMEDAKRHQTVSQAEQQYAEQVTGRHAMKSHLKPGMDKLTSLYRWARSQAGILMFRDPNV